MIFALANTSGTINVSIDYERPFGDIFTNATKAIIEQEQSLNIPCCPVDDKISRLFRRLPYLQLLAFVPHFEAILDAEAPVNIFSKLESDKQY